MEKYRWSEEIFDDLRSNIIAALDLSREQNDEEVCRFIEKEVEEYSRKNLLTLKEREQLEHLLFNSLRKYDAIQELLEDPEVTEIMINGASRIFYEKKGKLFRAQTHFSSGKWRYFINNRKKCSYGKKYFNYRRRRKSCGSSL